MRTRGLLVISVAALAWAAWAAPIASAAVAPEPISVPVQFEVQNVNRSGVSCASDGQPYRLHAELVGPRHALEGQGAATAALYLHEYSYDDFWHFRAVPGVDYATELARAGQVTVALDRLGYDDSPHPDGDATCIGAQADMAHQIVTALREGKYISPQLAPRAFQRVVLAGHSVGGIIAETTAYSFGGIDGLMLFAGHHTDFSPRAIGDGVKQSQVCAAGGQESHGAPHYAPFAPRDQDVEEYGFYDADPAVVEATKASRHLDPCGDVASLIPAAVTTGRHIGEISVPVLLLWGREDPAYNEDAGENQTEDFSGSDDVTTVYFERTAHALTLQRSAPAVRSAVTTWLGQRGFGTVAPPEPPPAPDLRGCRLRGRVLTGTEGSDAITGTRARESLFGFGGRDKLSGRGGRDCLNGGPGRDRLRGGPGRDRLQAADGERDVVNCGRGRDRAVVDRIDRVRSCERARRVR